MFSLRNIIFAFWGIRDKVRDILKINDKGFLQRFIELLAWDLDENEIDLINKLVENTGDPRSALVKFLPYREGTFGGLLDMVGSVSLRRKIIEYEAFLHRIRSTKDGYEVLFRWLGFQTATVVSLTNNTGFDSPTTFDDPIRVFDRRCATCGKYRVNLTGVISLTPQIIEAIYNVIKFNEPFDMELDNVFYNGVPLPSPDSLNLQNGNGFQLQNGNLLNVQ